MSFVCSERYEFLASQKKNLAPAWRASEMLNDLWPSKLKRQQKSEGRNKVSDRAGDKGFVLFLQLCLQVLHPEELYTCQESTANRKIYCLLGTVQTSK